ncbi:glycosyl transferase [Siculibacillus lacustris]|uniref:Glycosyl transferase n=1 Tax=Siculibacillus lacustris TaxID=1549641 RepID=A0A4Q9VMQ4_9HYPH|nr:glucoamylase family protein [Siculibacillus lacustris]TBW36784.1 glycosyl transferase [Siculibacillus lacustris]
MNTIFGQLFARRAASSPWADTEPVREETFGVERLEQHAESLAAAQPVTTRPPWVVPLRSRLNANAAVLLAAYRAGAAEVEAGAEVVPAAEWLLDNYHVVEEQIREIRDDLPPGYYRQLPKLADGPFAGYPRVFGLAWAFVAQTDSHFDPEILRRFLLAYQRIQPLTIGELWAVAITLRIVLVENLRRLTDQITAGGVARRDADALADRLLGAGDARAALESDIATRSTAPLSGDFASQLAKRLRDQDPNTTPALGWLQERLERQGRSIGDVVQAAQQRLGASNLTVRNVITSMRLISDIDWADLFESVSLVDARLRAASGFADMDFSTRNLYRSAVEQLARGSQSSELEIVDLALEAARLSAVGVADPVQADRLRDPGHHLIAAGRLALERAIGFRPPPRLWIGRINTRLGIGGYVGAIVATTVILLALVLWGIATRGVDLGWLALLAVVGFLPASELATALVNRLVTWSFGAVTLPGLELTGGVPESLRTIVVVPTLLTSEADLLEQIERLEVHHLSGSGGDLTFALLADGLDSDREELDGDAALTTLAEEAIARLNQRHGPGPGGKRFLFLHRRRVWDACEGVWMGWERKRGKLHELNRLLRGATDTTFVVDPDGVAPVPANVRFVITLDADTRLPRDAAIRLIGKMAHALNRPRFDAAAQRVVDGYAILQPRVTPSLPVGREGSFYQKVFSGPQGMDPYASAVSDVYQDLFGEGSYTGKGIYDVDAFEAALAGRVPDDTLLSHDLFEGIFARAGLASDVEVVEEAPSRYDVAAKRQHRWTRGDWQLLPWIFDLRSGLHHVPAIGRWKMIDNLRRSLLAPMTMLAFGASWLLPTPIALHLVLAIFGGIVIAAFLPTISAVLPRRAGFRLLNHLELLGAELKLAAVQTILTVAFLPDRAWRMGDAMMRTLVRLYGTRRLLLEWTTAAQSHGTPRLDTLGFYRLSWGGLLLGLGSAAAVLAVSPASWPIIVPFAALWALAPAIAAWASRAPRSAARMIVSADDRRELRLTARRTWRFFETFVGAATNGLPPDNFQEDPTPVVAQRTSPTNLGLALLSAVAARDFGWSGTRATVERLEAALGAMHALPRFRGHFFNWYDTATLQVLEPAYVSSVDSGNLAGHLIAVANACEEWRDGVLAADARAGLGDALDLARASFVDLHPAAEERGRQFLGVLDEFAVELASDRPITALAPVLKRLADKAVGLARGFAGPLPDDGSDDLISWTEALRRTLGEHVRDRATDDVQEAAWAERMTGVAATARALALEMDFAFLLDPERKLLSIGFSVADNRLDTNCYDLLASEARLASLFAVAKGDLPTRHWFRLGRAATPLGNGSALISWSGSMFEYLMPSLVMRAPTGSLLEQTNRLVVERQEAYGRSRGVPWGISESAYNARDIEFTYQYSNFGVPGLGLKRGLADNLVIAPYATGLATMVDPTGAQRNFERLAAMGARGRYGFYEALDFTRSRLPDDETVVIVRSHMAHHQGMTIVAIANALQAGRMRERFHREPMIQACELLMQERMPRDVALARPQAQEIKASASGVESRGVTVRRVLTPGFEQPITHLLSNGRYAVMLTATGAGYSRWRDVAVTRWREDVTRDDWGSFVFLRDTQSGNVWSACAQPLGRNVEDDVVVFGEDHAEFIHRDGALTTTLDVLVSGEDDGEVRRLSLTNGGRRPREIELTSYAELVLAPVAADAAHPAFSKMFVETSYLDEFGALIATRRLRTPDEPTIWAAHFVVVEGETVGDPQYETDRARFLGRGHNISDADVVTRGLPLGDTVGTVLDPIFSLRRRVRVAPGKVTRVAFWTVVAPTRAALLALVDKHLDRNAFDRAKTLAWTQAQVQLHHIGVDTAEAADFQRLAGPILYSDRRFRPSSSAIIRGLAPQSNLWSLAISGDLPIVLLRIDAVEDIASVHQLLRAHEYWRMKRLAVDLVIINEHASSYMQDLQGAIETAVRSSQSRPTLGDALAQGSVYALRADLLSVEARALLESVARVVLIARRGTLAEQIARIAAIPPAPRRPIRALGRSPRTPPVAARPTAGLEFFNGLGGFALDGREYVTVLEGGRTTPAPWLNVIANPNFGFQVSADGSGYTWAENSRENQITQWSNDPVSDPCCEAIYIRDEMSGVLWTPTAKPIRDGGNHVARHGRGYSRFEFDSDGIHFDLLQYVPLEDPIKISRLTLRNRSARPRRLSITAYIEWVLGTARGASAPFVTTEMDRETGAMTARNPWNIAASGRVAFADLGGRQTAWTADRTEFLGRNGHTAAPDALVTSAPLSGRTGAGYDPCAALQCVVEIAPGDSLEVVFFLGQCATIEAVRTLVNRYRTIDLDAVFAEVEARWATLLGTVQVETPDRAMDILLNGWLLYQTIACRIWARSAFYQASGAYGFRDQLQDGMALAFALPQETRAHLLRAAGRQFVEGDVQHWWMPGTGKGVRTRISDDRVWLAFAAATYVATSGDTGVLDESVPFLQGPRLAAGEHDAYFQPMIADDRASLYEHCARGLDQAFELTGALGLPLMGTGDWNDGMNRVGEGGTGESVWLGWLLLRTVALFAPMAEGRDPARAERWRVRAAAMSHALETQAWDGAWYRRATYDDGTWLGAADSEACKIDSIAQSWAVLSGAADPERAKMAMASMASQLVRPDDGMALLFTPPFDVTEHDPGYIRGYPPGLRENGGQYSHAAMWAILAFAELGEADAANYLFSLLNPINHALTPEATARYRVEPYVVAADVYSVAPHVGRGGWTWYTGSAAWMYRAGVEGILGLRREGAQLVVDPAIPAAWPGFSATVQIDGGRIEISVTRASGAGGGGSKAELDGALIAWTESGARVPLDGAPHRLTIAWTGRQATILPHRVVTP